MGAVHDLQKAKQLRQDRVELIEKQRTILDKAEGEERDLNTEERSEYDRLGEAADALKPRYERLEEQAKREAELDDARHRAREIGTPGNRGEDDPPRGRERRGLTARQRTRELRASDGYHAAFLRYMQFGEAALRQEERDLLFDPELRAQTIGTGSEGGFTTSVDTEGRIVTALEEEVAMRQLATVIPIGSDRNIPVVNDPSDEGDSAATDEGVAYNEDDVVLAQRQLSAFKLTRMVRASEELVQDDDAGFINLLPTLIARRFGPAEEAWFVSGGGTTEPRGVLLDSQLGDTAAAVGAIAADELFDFMYSVRRPYRRRASWLMNDSTVLAIRKLKDGDGNYLWRPGAEAGEPDRLLARPVWTSDQMPAIGTGNKSMAFGDFSYYWIGDRSGRMVKVLTERYAELGQIGYLASERTDGVLTVTEAVKHFIHP